jgi:uridylate kinase
MNEADIKPIYRRVLLKLSGEAISNGQKGIINVDMVNQIAAVIQKCRELGVHFGIIVGAGNIWRGKMGENEKMDRTRADHMGMLATTINALAIQDAFLQKGIETRVMTAIAMHEFAEPYIRNKAVHHLEEGRVVIFGCGLGIPFVSTDTAAVLRAAEINADVALLAKNVDAIYDKDPRKYPEAVRLTTLDHMDVIKRRLAATDLTAATLSMDTNVKIHVIGLETPENIYKAVIGENIGSVIDKQK